MVKNKKTSGVKPKTKKTEEVKDQAMPLNIIERAKGEKNLPKPQISNPHGGKPYTKEVFKLWLSLPDIFKGSPERIVELLGIQDDISKELLKIKSMTEFASEFGVIPQTLSGWRKDIEDDVDFMPAVKREMRKLTKNIMGALYRKTLEEGDAARVTIWMKIIEDWREQLGVEHSGTIGDGLSDKERESLKKLIAKNK